MGNRVRQVHVTHEKYAKRTIDEELAILNGRKWGDGTEAERFAFLQGWTCVNVPVTRDEERDMSLRQGPDVFGMKVFSGLTLVDVGYEYSDRDVEPFSPRIYTKDGYFVALNYKRGWVFEKEISRNSFEEEVSFFNSNEILWEQRPIKPTRPDSASFLRRVIRLFYDPVYSDWQMKTRRWKVKAANVVRCVIIHLGMYGWTLLNDIEFRRRKDKRRALEMKWTMAEKWWNATESEIFKSPEIDQNKPFIWTKYGRKIALTSDPNDPHVVRFVEVCS